MEVVAEAGDGPAALAAYQSTGPTSPCWTCACPTSSGAELITQIRKRDPAGPHHRADQLRRRRGRVPGRAGRRPGYLLKGTFPDGMLEEAIRTVHAGRR